MYQVWTARGGRWLLGATRSYKFLGIRWKADYSAEDGLRKLHGFFKYNLLSGIWLKH